MQMGNMVIRFLHISLLTCWMSLGLVQPLESRQWLIFHAKEGFFNGLIRQSFGHIFVGMVQEDPQQAGQLLAGYWGYYPKDGIQKEGFWGFMPGSIRNDWGAEFQDAFAVEVDESQFIRCLELIEEWDHLPYSLRARNCIDFVRSLVKSIGKMKDPEEFYLLPNAYLSALRSLNETIIYPGDFSSYQKVTQVNHYDGRLAKKFFTFQKWKNYLKKKSIFRKNEDTPTPD